MGQTRFSHFIVTRGGVECVLIQHAAYAPKGVLTPVTEGQAPTRFSCDRAAEKYPTIYARRRALRAVNATAKFIDLAKGSTIDGHEFVKRVVASTGEWKINPVKCPPAPKSK